jgi:abortive infection bacteriophage resistance protein
MNYNKPYLTVPQQRALLESRGMEISDASKADEYLRRIGYYRLSAYWYPFRRIVQLPDSSFRLDDTFKDGTQFRHATDLYAFDKGLRLIVLDAIERLEVSVRTEVALTIGRHGPRAHRDPSKVDKRFATAAPPRTQSMYSEWLRRLDDKEANSKEEFADHFRKKYNGEKMPIWIAVELLDFGPLSIYVSGIRFADLQHISASYGIDRPHLLKSWVRSISALRNICAHHSRLWNKPLIDQPALTVPGEIEYLDHIALIDGCNRRIYAALAIIQFLLKQISPRSKWADRLKAHMATFPDAPNITIADMGFPANWEEQRLWL